jgi:hypothetical protein
MQGGSFFVIFLPKWIYFLDDATWTISKLLGLLGRNQSTERATKNDPIPFSLGIATNSNIGIQRPCDVHEQSRLKHI